MFSFYVSICRYIFINKIRKTILKYFIFFNYILVIMIVMIIIDVTKYQHLSFYVSTSKVSVFPVKIFWNYLIFLIFCHVKSFLKIKGFHLWCLALFMLPTWQHWWTWTKTVLALFYRVVSYGTAYWCSCRALSAAKLPFWLSTSVKLLMLK